MKTLESIQSPLYFISPFDNGGYDVDNVLSLLDNSNYDFIILGNVTLPENTIHSSRFAFDDKIVVGYIDIGESTGLVTENYTNGIQDYFGNLHPAFDNLHTVQYWDPRWWKVITQQVDNQIAAGFDGIFLDVVDGYYNWLPGNRMGNPAVEDPADKMADLLRELRSYVDNKNLDRPFYLVANNPASLSIDSHPGVMDNFDLIFSEATDWLHAPFDGTSSVESSTADRSLNFHASAYQGKIVIGNDYMPLNDPDEIVDVIQSKIEYDWIPSLQHALQDRRILTSGPFISIANKDDSVATGIDNSVNYITERIGVDSVLIGGKNSTNYFIINDGGAKVIGNGNINNIYMRPESTYDFGKINIDLNYTLVGDATRPLIESIRLDDRIVMNNVELNSPWSWSAGLQTISIDITDPVDDIILTFANNSYTNQENFSNVVIDDISIHGRSLDLSKAKISNGASQTGYTYSNNGTFELDFGSFNEINQTSVTVDGLSGYSTAIYETEFDEFDIINQGNDTFRIVSEKYGISDTLNSVERLRFTDANIALDLSGTAGQAYRLYKAAFDRIPDLQGLGYWIHDMDNGAPITTVAKGFINSDEFKTLYGQNVSDYDFVRLLYNNVLDRDPDQAGFDYWINDLNNGVERSAILVGFSESAENQANVAELISNGIEYLSWEYPAQSYAAIEPSSIVTSVYNGPVDFLQFQILAGNNNDIVIGSDGNDFINLLGGNDAADGMAGQDVLDGGTESNFLTGGLGADTFFLDGRSGSTTWSTITDFSPEDSVNVWGWQHDVSRLILSLDNQGAEGYKGATFHYDLNGDRSIDTTITFSNLVLSSMPTPSVEEVGGNNYLLFA